MSSGSQGRRSASREPVTWLRDFTGNLYGHLAGETSGMLQDIPGLTTYPEWPSAKANLRIGLQSHPYLLSHRQLPFLFTKGPMYLSFLNKSLSQIITPGTQTLHTLGSPWSCTLGSPGPCMSHSLVFLSQGFRILGLSC